MNILLSVGHSILENGSCTSADGRPYGGVLEYAYNKSMVGRIGAYLQAAGHKAEILICPECQFCRSSEERNYKLQTVNSGKYDLVAELHLNASKYHNGRGSEVLYVSKEGKRFAQQIQKQLATKFQDRGVQCRNNLYMLTQTKPVAVMIESFFCDSEEDCANAEKTDVALLIAKGISGSEISPIEKTEEVSDIVYKVQTGAYQCRENAEKMKEKLLRAGFDAILVKG